MARTLVLSSSRRDSANTSTGTCPKTRAGACIAADTRTRTTSSQALKFHGAQAQEFPSRKHRAKAFVDPLVVHKNNIKNPKNQKHGPTFGQTSYGCADVTRAVFATSSTQSTMGGRELAACTARAKLYGRAGGAARPYRFRVELKITTA